MLKRFFEHENWVILLAALAVLMLVLLAMGLGHIHFQPGRPLARWESITIQVSVEKIAAQIADIPFWKQLVFWGLVFILIVIVASFFSPELRKRIILYFLRFALFVLALFYILTNFRNLFAGLDLIGPVASDANSGPTLDSAPTFFTPPQIPISLLYMVSLGVVLVLAAILFLAGRWYLRRPRQNREPQPLEDLAEIARASLANISSGRDWEHAIIEAYARMSEVVGARRGLRRRMDLTAAEFAGRLETAGLPAQAVQRLTRLFEAARYGAGQPSRDETAEAVVCLTTVLQACGVDE
jgi:Domain of unknown function (DUF4129)